MKKSYKVSVDCANCANKVEVAVNKMEGVNSAVVNFMAQKLVIDFDNNADKDNILKDIKKKGKKIDSDFEIEV